jgi:hypothetical protein
MHHPAAGCKKKGGMADPATMADTRSRSARLRWGGCDVCACRSDVWLRVGFGPVIPTIGAGAGDQVLTALEVEGGLAVFVDSVSFRCVGDSL